MFQINCLNPISKVGLDRLTADYKVIDNMNDAEGVLVRSASMHELELPENLLAVARPVPESTTFLWINVRKRVS